MRLFGRTRLDLMQIHNLVDWQTHITTLRDWKEKGRIRYIGITHYEPSAYAELERVIRLARPDFVQLALAVELSDVPGKVFPYNNKAVNLPAGVVQKASGRRMDELIREHLRSEDG